MILYEGESLIDGEPIVAIARPGGNIKIGRMLCTWILLQDVPPHKAAFDGRDESICGGCRYRANLETGERTCYVRTHLEPRTIWEAYKRGIYMYADENWDYCYAAKAWKYLGELSVRVGSYGDPAAVPTRVWEELIHHADRWTGYTHIWRTADPDLRRICMASVDTLEERREAQDAGWRTFFVVPHTFTKTYSAIESKLKKNILCPASIEAGRKTTCDKCRLCMGTGVGETVKSIWIPAHGPGKEGHTWID